MSTEKCRQKYPCLSPEGISLVVLHSGVLNLIELGGPIILEPIFTIHGQEKDCNHSAINHTREDPLSPSWKADLRGNPHILHNFLQRFDDSFG